MMQPNLEQLVQLAITGETAMWANETIHEVIEKHLKDTYKYWFNHEGTEGYYFTSLEHLIKFFFGNDAEQDEARSNCRIEEPDQTPRENGEEEIWNMIQEPNIYLTGDEAKEAYDEINSDNGGSSCQGYFFNHSDNKIIAFYNFEEYAENEYELHEEHEAIDWLHTMQG